MEVHMSGYYFFLRNGFLNIYCDYNYFF